MSDEQAYVVRIERSYAAPAGRVFDAWTNPEVMRRWLHPGPEWSTPDAETDLRVGGEVRVVMQRPDGTQVEHRGQYVVIDRPHRLVMNWTFGDAPDNQQLMELSFSEEEDGSTCVRLINSRITRETRHESQDRGWRGCLEQLERLLATSD